MKWRAYESIKFNDHEKIDWYFAALSQMVIVAAGGGKDTEAKDFLLDFSRSTPKSAAQVEAEQIAIWEAATGKKAKW